MTGKLLAREAQAVARRIDPGRVGVGPRELLDALVAVGVRIGGTDRYMSLYTALNRAGDRFERAARGTYRWLEPRVGDR